MVFEKTAWNCWLSSWCWNCGIRKPAFTNPETKNRTHSHLYKILRINKIMLGKHAIKTKSSIPPITDLVISTNGVRVNLVNITWPYPLSITSLAVVEVYTSYTTLLRHLAAEIYYYEIKTSPPTSTEAPRHKRFLFYEILSLKILKIFWAPFFGLWGLLPLLNTLLWLGS